MSPGILKFEQVDFEITNNDDVKILSQVSCSAKILNLWFKININDMFEY